MSSESGSPKVKRMRIDDCMNLVQERKAKEETSDSDVNSLLNMINFGQMDQRGGFSSEERELRKDRGDRLLQLFREQPSLSSTASARRVEKNYERAVIWDEITKKINDEFGKRLELLTVDKVKKLLTYYKKKEEGNFDFVKLPPSSVKLEPADKEMRLEEVLEMNNDDQAPPTNEKQISEILSMLSSSLSGTQTKSESRKSSSSGFLPLVIPPTAISESSTSSTSSSSAFSAGEQAYMLKKERHEFVVKLAEYYIQRMCFDNSSRSAAVNAERHNMWIRITQQTNEKYANVLQALGVEQAKKLYSNCKRRRRIKNDNDDSPGSFQSTARESAEPEDIFQENGEEVEKAADQSTPDLDFFGSVDNIIKGLEKDAEIVRLKAIVQEQEAKISKMKEFIEQQNAGFKKRAILLLEDVKTRVLNSNF